MEFDRYLMPATGRAGKWIATLGAACGIALAYFLAAQLGLSLLAKPSDVAVFWPASGIAAAILIAAGRRVGVALVLGVMVGSVAPNLMGDRSLSTSILKGFWNAGEAVLLAWLLDRWFGRPFTFCNLHRVGGFFIAAGVAVSISAVCGAVTMTTLQAAAPFWDVWRTWFLSDAVGILVVAPLLIELGQVTTQRRSRAELIEGTGTVVLIALASIYAVTFPTGTWLSFEPDAIAFLVLLWLTARNQEPFAIAGAFAVSIAVIGAATYGTGHFGDVTLPIAERVQGAQVVAIMVTAFTLVLSALFTERRRREAELKKSNNRLQLALDCAELGTWSLHLNTGDFENDVRDRRIHGHGQPPQTLGEMRSQVHPEDLSKLDAAFMGLGHAGGNCRTEYRLAPRTVQERAGREHWVAMEGTVVRHANGRPEQLLGVTRDITERKHAEDALLQREVELGEAQRLAHIGSWFWEAETDALVASDELLRIFGLDPATQRVLTLSDQRGRWHPVDDWERLKAAIQRTMQTGLGYELELRAFRNEVPIWITGRGAAVRNSKGQIVGLRGTVQDITERKQAELALAERNLQLRLAEMAGLIGSYAYDNHTEIGQISSGYAAIHSLPEGTTEITRSEWLARVHPDDIARLQLCRSEALRERREEYKVDYRIVRQDGEVRWIESRVFIMYGSDATGHRLTGVNIDVTERKHAEEGRKFLNAELDHRVKNALATVSAVVSHTRQGSRSASDFAAALEGRLRSMAATHELLGARWWQGVSLTELVRRELAPYAVRNNTELSGPEVVLRAEAGQAMAMVLHELATNAAKYGALSTKKGRVSIRWDRRFNRHPSSLILEWQEIGGPPVIAPGNPSYGTSTIRDLIPYEFAGTVDLDLAPEGGRCRIQLP